MGHTQLQRISVHNNNYTTMFPKSEPGQLQKNYATAWKITKDIKSILAVIYVHKQVSETD